ncbi:protein of unknown function (plasmid) [Cupriavidus taiwanensis]|uniref:Uncharacterized protein n=1 Tax=Cupriavidus taiwanensis TaxID=164546 RepID=A0A375HFW3_9BURK|nr:protein of unknown function [Cupriavidus taiwanensis]SPD49170.1 protein of unknown function [Cupriavidus taiwanensis]
MWTSSSAGTALLMWREAQIAKPARRCSKYYSPGKKKDIHQVLGGLSSTWWLFLKNRLCKY